MKCSIVLDVPIGTNYAMVQLKPLPFVSYVGKLFSARIGLGGFGKYLTMAMYPKPKRFISESYISFVAQRPWCVPLCYRQPGAPHHTKTVGSGGSDMTVIPLCAKHHCEIHNCGEDKFSKKNHGINLGDVKFELLQSYIEGGHYAEAP